MYINWTFLYINHIIHIPLFIFPKLENAGHRFYSRFALGSVIFQCLRGIPQVDYFERT